MSLVLIDTLNWLAIVLNRWIATTIFVFGALGNLFNLLIFTREIFYKQSCSIYFVAISMNNLLMYFIGLSTRILDEGFQMEIFGGNSNIYCQIRTYLVYSFFAISNWFFIFASLDRFYSTNQSALERQRFCSNRMALKFISMTIIGCLVIHIHVPIYYAYFYKLNPLNQLTLTCTTNDTIYNIFLSIFMLIFYSLLPPILMSIIGLLTFNNIRKSRQHINPSTTTLPIAVRRDRNRLLKSLAVQVIILIILTSPHSCYWMYMAFTTSRNSSKTNSIRAWERFSSHIVRLLLYVNYGSSFYIQIILSKTFRYELIKLIDNCKRRCRHLY